MKRLAAFTLLVLFAVGCAGKNGGGRGLVIQRTADDADRAADHGDLDRSAETDRPFGQ